MSDKVQPPVDSIATAATLACLWEAAAPKPGNVHRGADFADLTFVDLATSGALIGPIITKSADLGVGKTVLDGVRATRMAVATNANLGILLLMSPLAVAHSQGPLRRTIADVVTALTVDDARLAYEAIRLAQPGGLGQSDRADVNSPGPVDLTLTEAMKLASERDLIARQYATNFSDVFCAADDVRSGLTRDWSMADSIVHAFLGLNAARPDTLIARKCGQAAAEGVSKRCAAVLNSGRPGDSSYYDAVADLDFYLRSDGNRRNPGATADVTAAALFVFLLEDHVNWPLHFYLPAR